MWNNIKKNDTLLVLGFAPNTRDLAPWSKDVDIFTLNEWYNHGVWQEDLVTAHFQIHPYENFMRADNLNDPKHPEWMKQKHPFPIFTQEVYADIPSSIKYPLKEAIKVAGARYLTSSFSYMFAMGMLLDYKRIELYGFNMGSGTEYQYQKPGAEYLIGVAKGRGIDVFIPEQSLILKDLLYGYESKEAGYLQHLEFRRTAMTNLKNERISQWNQAKGAKFLVKELMSKEFGEIVKPLLDITLENIEKSGRKVQADINYCIGAEDEVDYQSKYYQKLLGEFNNG
jgi:hypothetical protein